MTIYNKHDSTASKLENLCIISYNISQFMKYSIGNK